MNILILSIEFPPHGGGAGSYTRNLSVGLARIGQRVTVLTSIKNKDSEIGQNIDKHLCNNNKELTIIRRRFIPKLYILLFSLYCFKIIQKEKFDCLIVADAGAQKCIAYFMDHIKIPIFTVFHGTEINNYFKNQTKLFKIFRGDQKLISFFNFTTACIAVSEDMRNHIIKQLPELSQKLYIVHHGIDTLFFTKGDNKNKQKARMLLGLPSTKKIIFSASRLIREKGHDTLINILPTIIDQIPDLILIIAGIGPDRPYLESLIKKNGLDEYVVFVNQLYSTDIITYYHSCDLFVLLTRRGSEESFGLVFLEANACKRAVLAGKTGGVTETVENGISGVVVDPLDLNLISESILNLLQDEQKLKQIERSAYHRVINNFTVEKMAKNTFKIIYDKIKK